MASHIKKGESILIPFRNGISISDSQLKPRMYKTVQAFEKSFPGYYMGTKDIELVEYTGVVRCKNCTHGVTDEEEPGMCKCVESAEYDSEYGVWLGFVEYHTPDFYCAFGERKDNGQ